MIRATTPTHSFVFEENPSNFSKILITYSQNGKIVLEKTQDELIFSEHVNSETSEIEYIASVQLTQEETIMFSGSPGYRVQIQVRVLTNYGEALASEIKTISIQDVLNDEVLI